jgi:hypothetical protein
MPIPDLTTRPAEDLFAIHAAILDELRKRGLVRSYNNPVGDYAERLVCNALQLVPTANSAFGYDAYHEATKKRYQIKARRLTAYNTSRLLSGLRMLETEPFDFLVGVLFDAKLRPARACVVPINVVKEHVGFSVHTNAHRFVLRDSVWGLPGVEDITERVRAVVATADLKVKYANLGASSGQ